MTAAVATIAGVRYTKEQQEMVNKGLHRWAKHHPFYCPIDTPDWMVFPPMYLLVPVGEQGSARIRHYKVTKHEILMAALDGDRWAETATGITYTMLLVDGGIMMSDTYMERRSSLMLLEKAKGHVLIGGLGIGMVLHPLACNPKVESVTVVEKSKDVIALIAPTVPKSVHIVHADIFTYKPTRKLDTMFFDIWPGRAEENLKGIAKLHQRFKFWKAPGGWMDSWFSRELRDLRREDRESGRW